MCSFEKSLRKTIKVFLILVVFGNFYSEALFTHKHVIPKISTKIYKHVLQFFDYLPVKLNPLAKMELPQVIRHYGYPVEIHKVVTQDGYILSLHRIPHGRTSQNIGQRQPFFLQDGLLCSPGSWLFMGPGKSLAFSLADAGYDVWLGNSRGTTYSRSHLKLNHTDPEFWDYSWHEMGMYDIPANIDYILQNTGHDKLFHAGHSQGTTSFYVMGSMKPEYNDKVIAHFSLAPIAYMKHLDSWAMQILTVFWRYLWTVLELIQAHLYVQSSVMWQKVGQLFCKDGALTQHICTTTLFIFTGFNYPQFNTTQLPIIMGFLPAGISLKQAVHYAQLTRSGHFRQFDNRTLLTKWTHPAPLDYNLGNVRAPVHLLWGPNDLLSGKVDVRRLCRELRNCKGIVPMSDPDFNHMDFLFAKDIDPIVNRLVVRIANSYMIQRLPKSRLRKKAKSHFERLMKLFHLK